MTVFYKGSRIPTQYDPARFKRVAHLFNGEGMLTLRIKETIGALNALKPPYICNNRLRHNADYNYFIDEDGKEFGDISAIVALLFYKLPSSLADYVRGPEGTYILVRDLAKFFQIPLYHAALLVNCDELVLAGYPVETLSPSEVARTLQNYVDAGGKKPPSYQWVLDENWSEVGTDHEWDVCYGTPENILRRQGKL